MDVQPNNGAPAGGTTHIDELLKSANRFSWAVALLGFQQLGHMLPTGGTAGIAELPQQIESALCNLASVNAPAPKAMVGALLEMMAQSAGVFRQLSPQSKDRLVWEEFRNKVRAFHLFQQVDLLLNLSADATPSLAALVEKLAALGPSDSVWTAEGLGRSYTEMCCSRRPGIAPHGLLFGDRVTSVPAASLLPLHTGMGLALAEIALKSEPRKAEHLAAGFLELCRNNSHPAYLGAVCEASGLVARNLYPHFIPVLELQFSRMNNADLLGYFWHGVGRAIYFAPVNFLPWRSAPWSGWRMSMEEPPHALGRQNAMSGYAWALTLVNLRHPEIMLEFLNHHGTAVFDEEAFTDGVTSALIVWLESAPDDPALEAFCNYQPSQAGRAAVDLWDRTVRRPAVTALAQWKADRRRPAIGELFRFRFSGPKP